MAEGQEMQEALVLDALRVTKTSARDLLNKSLPAPDHVVANHQKVLLQLAQAARDKKYRVRLRLFMGGLSHE